MIVHAVLTEAMLAGEAKKLLRGELFAADVAFFEVISTLRNNWFNFLFYQLEAWSAHRTIVRVLTNSLIHFVTKMLCSVFITDKTQVIISLKLVLE